MDFARILHPTSAPPNNNPRSRTPKRPSVSRSLQSSSNATYQRHNSAAADIPTLPSQRLTTPPPARYLASQPVQPFLPRNEAEASAVGDDTHDFYDSQDSYLSSSADRDYFSEFTVGDSAGDDSDLEAFLDQEISALRTPPHRYSNTPIDLTLDSSPEMPRRDDVQRRRTETRQPSERKRDTRQNSIDLTGSGPSKRRKLSVSGRGDKREHRDDQQAKQDTNVEAIDLSKDDENGLAAALEKQRADAVAAQKETRGQDTKLNGLTCTVCLDNINELTATSCGHAFCRKCLTEWLVAGEREHPKRSNCPACRKSLKRNGRGNDVIPLEIMKRSALNPRTHLDTVVL